MDIRRPKRSSFLHGLGYGGPVLAYAGLIFVLSSASKFPDEVSFVNGIEKLAHFLEYYLFGFLICRWLMSKSSVFIGKNALFFTIFLGICFGITDEWHQSYVPGRDATSGDVLFDAFGIIAAAVTYKGIIKRSSLRRKVDETGERKFIHEH